MLNKFTALWNERRMASRIAEIDQWMARVPTEWVHTQPVSGPRAIDLNTRDGFPRQVTRRDKSPGDSTASDR